MSGVIRSVSSGFSAPVVGAACVLSLAFLARVAYLYKESAYLPARAIPPIPPVSPLSDRAIVPPPSASSLPIAPPSREEMERALAHALVIKYKDSTVAENEAETRENLGCLLGLQQKSLPPDLMPGVNETIRKLELMLIALQPASSSAGARSTPPRASAAAAAAPANPTHGPVGIANESGSDCFVIAAIQALVLPDAELMGRIQANRTPKYAAIRTFLRENSRVRSGTVQTRILPLRECLGVAEGQDEAVAAYGRIKEAAGRNPLRGLHFTCHRPFTGTDSLGKFIADAMAEGPAHNPRFVAPATASDQFIVSFPRREGGDRATVADEGVTRVLLPDPGKIILSGDCFRDGQKAHYELASFTKHTGTALGGHWIAFVKRNGEYYRLDDRSCTHINQAQFIQEARSASDLRYTKIGKISLFFQKLFRKNNP